MESWERSEREWNIQSLERALHLGDVEVWRLLNGRRTSSTRPMLSDNGSVLITDKSIEAQLKLHHSKSIKEYLGNPSDDSGSVMWSNSFSENDLVLEISDELVIANIRKLKNSAVPDDILPKVVKLIFGNSDLVRPLAEMIRAVVRTRMFPTGGKIAKQAFLWKGKGNRESLDNCRPITLANVHLKLAESCVKDASQSHWSAAGFPRNYWGHFFGAPESIYIWMTTVERFYRQGKSPKTALTDISQAFNCLNHTIFKKKLINF